MASISPPRSHIDSMTVSESSTPSATNAFDILGSKGSVSKNLHLRDRCSRLIPAYNDSYNPYQPRPVDLPADYSPYRFGEPLHDDRPVVVANLKPNYTVYGASKRPRTQWVWQLGYAIHNHTKASTKQKSNLTWVCKLCHHDTEFSRHKEYYFDANTLNNAERHLLKTHHLDKDGDIWRKQLLEASGTARAQPSGIVGTSHQYVIPFRQQEFKNAFLEWIVLDNVKHRKAASYRLLKCFKFASKEAAAAIPTSHGTVETWIHAMFKEFEPTVISEITTAKSRISISFDGWGSKREKISVLGVVVHFINKDYEAVTRLIGLPELPAHGKTGVDQCAVLYPLLKRFGVTSNNLGYFILDNASNNDTTLVELAKKMAFLPAERRLRCMGHILNLIAEAYLFGQDAASYDEDYKQAGPLRRRQLWRQRGQLGKLHNLVAHVMASGKRTDIFEGLQSTLNVGKAANKRWKLVLDGGIRWNASFAMIERALELRPALDQYALKLKVSKDALDIETADKDYLDDEDWETLEIIHNQLEPLFRLTKDLEGNADLQDGACKASHGALWEILPAFDFILGHFERLQRQAKNHEFDGHPSIQSSITEAWNQAKKYYGKTDESVAWIAAVVLHPRFKWKLFEAQWTGSLRSHLQAGKASFKKLWQDRYKGADVAASLSQSPEPEPVQRPSFLEEVLNRVAPSDTAVALPTRHKDELALYLEEPQITGLGVMEYWKAHEAKWPHLTQMAFDFLAVPAMSSECERVFSSVSKQTTPESSRLSGELLWHQECLSNWQRRGAIRMESAFNAVLVDFTQ